MIIGLGVKRGNMVDKLLINHYEKNIYTIDETILRKKKKKNVHHLYYIVMIILLLNYDIELKRPFNSTYILFVIHF